MNAFAHVLRSALELLLAAQLRGIPHPDEPLVRGHRCIAAARRRLRHRASRSCPAAPAQQSGQLNANDRILAVGQGKNGKLVDVVGWRLDDVVQLIRGQIGTTVRLQVQPGTAPRPARRRRSSTLPRSKITLEAQAAKKEVRKIKRGDDEARGRRHQRAVASTRTTTRSAAGDEDYRSTTRDVRKLIDELKAEGGVDSLVLDLR